MARRRDREPLSGKQRSAADDAVSGGPRQGARSGSRSRPRFSPAAVPAARELPAQGLQKRRATGGRRLFRAPLTRLPALAANAAGHLQFGREAMSPTLWLTTLAMIAFAGNSLLARLAHGRRRPSTRQALPACGFSRRAVLGLILLRRGHASRARRAAGGQLGLRRWRSSSTRSPSRLPT